MPIKSVSNAAPLPPLTVSTVIPEGEPEISIKVTEIARPIYLEGVGAKNADRPGGWRIEPPELVTPADYDTICQTLPRRNSLEDFKRKFPENFEPDSPDALTWKKAMDFWAGKYSETTQYEVLRECPQQIQAIRSHLWKGVKDEDAKVNAAFQNRWYVKAITSLRNFMNTFSINIALISLATIIAKIALVVLAV